VSPGKTRAGTDKSREAVARLFEASGSGQWLASCSGWAVSPLVGGAGTGSHRPVVRSARGVVASLLWQGGVRTEAPVQAAGSTGERVASQLITLPA
jgi:hypothetical protein